ncbi:TPA: ATP-binding protein [Candidatus Micrarchaeota archaeon]|nr:ATP-binding protein [Candidatus Micrarchaeota archaeon]
MDSKLGTIIALDGSPSTSEFSFVIDREGDVKKGQYVEVQKSGSRVFGFVSEIVRANRYFERAESVAEYEKASGIKEHFPSDSWEYAMAQVKILGTYEGERFIRTFSPPSPGDDVFNADGAILRQFLGFTDDGLHLGSIQHHDVPAKLCMTRLFQKHLAILAMSGAGKSHLSSVLLEELLERRAEDGRIAVIVVDIHGEYAGFAHDDMFGKRTAVIDGEDIKLPLRKISPEMVEEWFPDLSSPQRDVLRHAMSALRGENEETEGFTISELTAAVDAADVSNDNVKRALKRSLSELRRHRFVTKNEERPRLDSEVKPGKMVILDFSSLDSLRKKQILVCMLARRLFRLRKEGRIPPFLMLIEEAHNFAREHAEARDAVSRGIIETIAREGRKFGACICLISQRPVNLSTTALSQCNTHIILRVTNPNDLDHIQKSSEGIDARVSRSITGLKVGEAIVVGEAVNYPVFVSVRQRKSVKREKGAPLHRQAADFEKEESRKEEQVQAFL